MELINKNKTGLALGFFVSFMHLVWSILVVLGIAQVLLDFVLKIHMISIPITVGPFGLTKAIALIIVTFIIGYIFGWLVAFFWNKCAK